MREHDALRHLRPAHDYGPHRPEDAPVLEPIKLRMRDVGWVTHPVSPLVEQMRVQVNTAAHRAAQRYRELAGGW